MHRKKIFDRELLNQIEELFIKLSISSLWNLLFWINFKEILIKKLIHFSKFVIPFTSNSNTYWKKLKIKNLEHFVFINLWKILPERSRMFELMIYLKKNDLVQRRPTLLWELPQMWRQRCHWSHICKRKDSIAKFS